MESEGVAKVVKDSSSECHEYLNQISWQPMATVVEIQSGQSGGLTNRLTLTSLMLKMICCDVQQPKCEY